MGIERITNEQTISPGAHLKPGWFIAIGWAWWCGRPHGGLNILDALLLGCELDINITAHVVFYEAITIVFKTNEIKNERRSNGNSKS